VFGLSAARAVMAKRPQEVRQIAHTPEVRKELAELLREAARLRIAYREVPREELARIAGSTHHEGICLQVAERRPVSLPELIRGFAADGFVLALDGVDNPHNIGALLRSAGFFGARGLLIAGRAGELRLGPAAVRVAEGAAEHVPVCFVADLPEALDILREAKAFVIGADAHEGVAERALERRARSVLVLGNERAGLTPAVKQRCHALVHIPGSGAVESLNVSVAAGILMAALTRSRS
jgi:TrmH RNA methyltransferase